MRNRGGCFQNDFKGFPWGFDGGVVSRVGWMEKGTTGDSGGFQSGCCKMGSDWFEVSLS